MTTKKQKLVILVHKQTGVSEKTLSNYSVESLQSKYRYHLNKTFKKDRCICCADVMHKKNGIYECSRCDEYYGTSRCKCKCKKKWQLKK